MRIFIKDCIQFVLTKSFFFIAQEFMSWLFHSKFLLDRNFFFVLKLLIISQLYLACLKNKLI
jgi:hypothetical protein